MKVVTMMVLLIACMTDTLISRAQADMVFSPQVLQLASRPRSYGVVSVEGRTYELLAFSYNMTADNIGRAASSVYYNGKRGEPATNFTVGKFNAIRAKYGGSLSGAWAWGFKNTGSQGPIYMKNRQPVPPSIIRYSNTAGREDALCFWSFGGIILFNDISRNYLSNKLLVMY